MAVEQLRFNLEVVGSYITGYLFLSLLCYPSLSCVSLKKVPNNGATLLSSLKNGYYAQYAQNQQDMYLTMRSFGPIVHQLEPLEHF